MTLLAQAYEQTGKPEQAASVAREALGMYPASQFTPMLKARLAAAKRALSSSEGTDAGVTGSAGQPASPTAAAPSQPTAAAPAVPGDGGTSAPRGRPAMFKTAAESSAGLLPPAPTNPPGRQP
jgi:hypothetical protein